MWQNIKSMFSSSGQLNLGNTFTAQLESDRIALENYLALLNRGVPSEEAFAMTMRESSIAAQEYANSINTVGLSTDQCDAKIKNFVATQNMSRISTLAQNKSFSSCSSLISTYNSGLTNLGLTQTQFAQSVSQSNPILGRYLANVGAGKASMFGYVGSLVAAKAATIALRIATTALNAVVGMGIGLVISLITSLLSSAFEGIADSFKSTAEKLEDVNSKIQEITTTVQSAAKDFQDLKSSVTEIAPRFAELAQGVDSFGKNISLTDEEYAEFLKLNNQIAEMFPELNLGLDENGNYMLALSGSADTLQQSLMDLLETQRQLAAQKIAEKIPEEIDAIKEFEKIETDDLNKKYGNFIQARDELLEDHSAKQKETDRQMWGDNAEIERLIEDNKSMFSNYALEIWREFGKTQEEYNKLIKQYTIEIDGVPWMDWYAILNSDDFVEIFDNINKKQELVTAQIESKWKNLASFFGSWLQTDDIFVALDDDTQKIAQYMVKNLDFGSDEFDTQEEIENYIRNNILAPLRDASPEVKQAYNDLFNLDTSELSFSDYEDKLFDKAKLIAEALGKDVGTVLAEVGLDAVYQTNKDNRDDLISRLNITEAMVDSLSVDEINSALTYVKDYGIESWNELQTFIDKKRLIDSFHVEDIENLRSELDSLKSTYKDISGIIEDYNENGYYSLDNLKSLLELEPEYINTLIDENGQINLNSQAYKDYVAAKAKTLVIDQIKSLYESILNMSVEEAQAYANAAAFDVETKSLQDLMLAATQYYYILAQAKDSQNDTTAYTDALTQSLGTVANYAAIYDSWLSSLSTSNNEFSQETNKSTSALEAQKEALEKQKDALEDEKDALEDAKDALEAYKDALEGAQDDIQSLIDLVIDYIKQIKEDEKKALEDQIDRLEKQKDALDEQKDKYAEVIDKKKEALKLAKEEKEAADELAAKQKSVAKSRLALEVAGLDDSSAGRKAQKQASDELSESQKDLNDFLYDQAYEKEVDALDKQQEKFEETIEKQKKKIDKQIEHIEKQIAKIDKYLNNSRKLYIDACNMIDKEGKKLYNKLWKYVYKHTTMTKSEFNHLWSSAQAAIKKYKKDNESLVSVMEKIQNKIYSTDKKIASLSTQIGKVEKKISKLDTAISNTSSSIKSTSGAIASVSTNLDGLSTSISNYIQKLRDLAKAQEELKKKKQKKKYKYKYMGKTYKTTATSREQAISNIIKQIKKDYNGKPPVPYDVYHGIQAYAKGTRNAAGGLSVTQEDGLEAIFGKLQSGQYTMMPQGSQVFNAGQTDNLYDFSSDPQGFVKGLIDKFSYANFFASRQGALASAIKNVSSVQNKMSGDTTVSAPINIQIQGDATQSTVNALKKEANNIKEDTIKTILHYASFNKKNRW